MYNIYKRMLLFIHVTQVMHLIIVLLILGILCRRLHSEKYFCTPSDRSMSVLDL